MINITKLVFKPFANLIHCWMFLLLLLLFQCSCYFPITFLFQMWYTYLFIFLFWHFENQFIHHFNAIRLFGCPNPSIIKNKYINIISNEKKKQKKIETVKLEEPKRKIQAFIWTIEWVAIICMSLCQNFFCSHLFRNSEKRVCFLFAVFFG